jgi:hypothetical protein
VINLFCSLGLSVVEQTYTHQKEKKEYNKQIDKRKKRSPRSINLIITV